MYYHYRKGCRKRSRWALLLPSAVSIGGGIYLLVLLTAPQLPTALQITDHVEAAVPGQSQAQPTPRRDVLHIPKLRLSIAIVSGTSDKALDNGAWHRRPDNGNPEKGGNFVLSAHRFELGWTPQGTKNKSPFYNLHRLESGDDIYVDFGEKSYHYKVNRLYKVPRTATEIEAPSSEPKLTLYSCDMRGERFGRIVVEAAPAPPEG